LLLNSALNYVISRVQVNQNGLKLNGTNQLLVNADDINTFGGKVYTVKKNAEALIFASKDTGLDVNAYKIECATNSQY
jgi:hypothetical protein